jgi:integrase
MATPKGPKGEVVRNPVRGGFAYALRFSANGKRRYVSLGRPDDGWSDERAQAELANVLADVRRGIWRPYVPPIVEAQEDPTFHEFATAWFESVKPELRPETVTTYENHLRVHLLPFFKSHRLSQISVGEVDRYRESKVREKVLAASTINKTITRLGQILEVAVERELMTRNPATVGGKRRKVKAPAPRRAYLDRAEQIVALLDAAGELDAEARANAKINRRAMLATLTFAGLRISELVALDWADVDLAAGRLRVRQSKTDAGVRHVDLLPVLAGELRALKAARLPRPAEPVFPNAAGVRFNRKRIGTRVLGCPESTSGPGVGAIGRANARLEAGGLSALPEGLTPHALRRTYASVLFALGRPAPYVMAQIGHTDATMTLGLYAKVMNTSEVDHTRLRQLVEGDHLAVDGSGGDLAGETSAVDGNGITTEVAH